MSNVNRCDKKTLTIILKIYFEFGKILSLPSLTILSNLAHFRRCKWPNIKQII